MMKMIPSLSTCGLLFAASFLGSPSEAAEPINFQIRNNADLLALCNTQPTEPNYVASVHFCQGFGVGFVRYHETLKEGKDFDPLFCFPEGLTRNQAFREYVAYSQAHHEYDHELVGDVLMKFLTETYPCSPKAR